VFLVNSRYPRSYFTYIFYIQVLFLQSYKANLPSSFNTINSRLGILYQPTRVGLSTVQCKPISSNKVFRLKR